MKFAKYSFLIAGIYGLLILTPQYFLEEKNNLNFPPAITHPEYFYGFIGVGLAWQLAFLLIGLDPLRHRALMIPAMVEKFSFFIAVLLLFFAARVNSLLFGLGCVDLALGILFFVSFFTTKQIETERRA